ncbi:MAG: metalloregulator ArsR/SmtB family transcription factor [Actinomycetota bacterium]
MATPATATDSSPSASSLPSTATGTAEALCCPPLLGPSLSDDAADQLATTLKALADPVRLKLVNVVAAAGETCACDLPEILDRSQPTVSHHLSILVKAGVLEREQRGKWAWFRLDRDRLTQICAALGNPDC